MSSGAADYMDGKKVRWKQKRNAFAKGVLEFKFNHPQGNLILHVQTLTDKPGVKVNCVPNLCLSIFVHADGFILSY